MERSLQKHGLINLVVLLLAAISSLVIARYTHTLAGEVVCAYLGLGVLVAGVSWFQMRLEEQERVERLEYEELTREAERGRLFEGSPSDVLPARRSRELFEKYFVRVFAVGICFLQGGSAWWLWNWLEAPTRPALVQPLLAMALLGMFSLVLFLLGKYSSGLARLQDQRLLRPGANYLLLGAYLEGLVVLGLIGAQWELANADTYLARGLVVLLMVLALEMLLGLLFEMYRPRIRGQAALLLYDSRLVGLLGRPEGVFATAAHALDYQFGFKVSETWFYQFLQRALAWMVLGQVAILLLSTCLVFVEAGEEALLERFGRPVASRDVLQAGLHFKLPWPIDQARRFRTHEIQSFNIGFEHEEGGEETGRDNTVLWTVSHYKEEFHLLVASRESLGETNQAPGRRSPPVNLLSMGIPVQYRILDLRAWAYQHVDAAPLLEHMATREVVRYLVGVDIHEMMSTGRFPAAEELRRRIQERADALSLGVEIVFVGLQDVHPPVQVAESYEKVVAERQNREAAILAARAYQVRTNALAKAESLRARRDAEAEKARLEVGALARAALFTNQIPVYEAAPSVYAQRAYLETLARGAANVRKVIVATTNTEDVIFLNLEEKLAPDITDIGVPELP